MSFKDQVINLIVQGKDLFTSEAKKSEKALQELGVQSENLNEQLNELKDQQAAIKAIDDLTSAISKGEGKYVDSAKALDLLKQEQRAATAEAKALEKAQATAAASTAKLEAEYSQTVTELAKYDQQLAAARAEVERLTATQGEGAQASKAQAQALSTAKDDLQKLETAQKNTETSAKALGAELEKQSSELKQLGVDVDNAAQKKAEYALKVKSASTALTQLGTHLGRNKAELEKQQTVLNKAGIDMDKLADASKDLKTQQTAAETALKGVNDKLARHEQLLAESKKSAGDFGGSIKAATGSLLAMAGAYVGVDRLWESLKSILSAGDNAAAFSAQMAAMMGSIAAGEQATAWIKDFANRTGTELDAAKEAFASLKTFGIDPMTGALQAMVDYNAKLGGSQEKLEGIILAVGQAWAKQKLQGEEILQLVERGVPVWDLLAKVTGKNSVELAKLSEQGKLGRDVMQKLFDEMGKQADGQASKSLDRLGGQVALISNKWTEFKQVIADSGAYKVAVDLLQQLNAKFDELNTNGKIKAIAQEISDFFSGMLKNGGDSLKLMLENISAFATGLNTVSGGIRLVFNTATSALYTLAQGATKSLEVMIRATAALFETVGADEIAKKQREAADAMAAVSDGFKKAVEQDARDATAALRQMGIDIRLDSDTTTQAQVDNTEKVKAAVNSQIEQQLDASQKALAAADKADAAAAKEVVAWQARQQAAKEHYDALKTSGTASMAELEAAQLALENATKRLGDVQVAQAESQQQLANGQTALAAATVALRNEQNQLAQDNLAKVRDAFIVGKASVDEYKAAQDNAVKTAQALATAQDELTKKSAEHTTQIEETKRQTKSQTELTAEFIAKRKELQTQYEKGILTEKELQIAQQELAIAYDATVAATNKAAGANVALSDAQITLQDQIVRTEAEIEKLKLSMDAEYNTTAELTLAKAKLAKEEANLADLKREAVELAKIENATYVELLVLQRDYENQLSIIEGKFKAGLLTKQEYEQQSQTLKGTLAELAKVVGDSSKKTDENTESTKQNTEALKENTEAVEAASQSLASNVSLLDDQGRAWNAARQYVSDTGTVYVDVAASVEELTARIERLGVVNEAYAAGETKRQLTELQSSLAVRKQIDLIDSQTLSLAALDRMSAQAARGMYGLSSVQLEPLTNAIDAARAKFRALTDEINETTLNIQDRLDTALGNQKAITERKFASELKEVESLIETAKSYGDSQLVAKLQKSLSDLKQAQELERKAQQAQSAADAAAKAQAQAEAKKQAEAAKNVPSVTSTVSPTPSQNSPSPSQSSGDSVVLQLQVGGSSFNASMKRSLVTELVAEIKRLQSVGG